MTEWLSGHWWLSITLPAVALAGALAGYMSRRLELKREILRMHGHPPPWLEVGARVHARYLGSQGTRYRVCTVRSIEWPWLVTLCELPEGATHPGRLSPAWECAACGDFVCDGCRARLVECADGGC